MPLFPSDIAQMPLGAQGRVFWLREQGARRLFAFLALVVIVWFIAGQIQDSVLLSKRWPALKPDLNGLTVVGTLNPHSSFDRNIFKIFTENTASRVTLTDYGWNLIFDPRNGEMCSGNNSDAIKHALSVNDFAGYAMLEPYLKAAVEYHMGDKGAFKRITSSMPITVPSSTLKGSPTISSLGSLIEKYSSNGPEAQAPKSEGGSESGRSVEQVIALSPDLVASVCPVALTQPQFTSAELNKQPANIFAGSAYSITFNLTSEGRSRFFQWSHAHMGENMVFVLKHQVVLNGYISQVLDTNSWEITNIQDRDAAQSLVDYINRKSGE